jgi:DNA-binding CsgD family transcriptional regulator
MNDSRFSKLTEKHKQCLRLVNQGYEVKEIARLLGLSPSAVIERLRTARQVLGVTQSRTAARMLAMWEVASNNMQDVDIFPPLADTVTSLSSLSGSEGGLGEPSRSQNASSLFNPVEPVSATERSSWPRPWRGKGVRANDMTASDRLYASIGLTMVTAIGAAVLLIAIVQLMTFLIRVSRTGG